MNQNTHQQAQQRAQRQRKAPPAVDLNSPLVVIGIAALSLLTGFALAGLIRLITLALGIPV